MFIIIKLGINGFMDIQGEKLGYGSFAHVWEKEDIIKGSR